MTQRKILVIRTIELMGEADLVYQQLDKGSLQPDGTVRRVLRNGLMRECQRREYEISDAYFALMEEQATLCIGQQNEEKQP